MGTEAMIGRSAVIDPSMTLSTGMPIMRVVVGARPILLRGRRSITRRRQRFDWREAAALSNKAARQFRNQVVMGGQ